MAAAKVPFLKGNLPSIKCFAMYKAPIEKYWLETIGETCLYKVDGATCYGHSLKGPTVYKMHCRIY